MGPLPLLLLLVPLVLGAAEKERKSGALPVPSDEEMVILHLLNGFRADVGRGQVPLVHLMQEKALPASPAMWARSMGKQKPAPPLVVNPLLMDAARTVLASGAAPVEKQPMAFAEPLRAAGYTPDATGQVLIARDAVSLPVAFAAALTQVVGERVLRPTVSYPIFAAAEAVAPAWREVGIAVSMGKGEARSVVVVLGAGSAKRHLGGVAYADANRNGRYDLGEGQSGVQVGVGELAMTTGAAGAWWLALPGDEAAEAVFTVAGHRAVRPVPAGAGNQVVDWRVPNAADLKLADRLIAEAEKDPAADPAKRRKALTALLSGTRLAVLDDARQAKVATLVEPIQGEFDALLGQAMAALAEEPPVFKERMAELKKPWEGGLAKLSKEFDGLYALRQQVSTVLAAPSERQPGLVPPVLKQVEKACADSTDPVCLAQLGTWRESLLDALPAKPR